MSIESDINLTPDDLKELNNIELIAYKQKIFAHGEAVEDYIMHLRKCYNEAIEELKAREWEIEYELACIQQENEEDLIGSGNPPETYIN
tara:strand:- start:20595 stop:20861 length:267 start_codon:yes stop_codon:yes gene_type:complete